MSPNSHYQFEPFEWFVHGVWSSASQYLSMESGPQPHWCPWRDTCSTPRPRPSSRCEITALAGSRCNISRCNISHWDNVGYHIMRYATTPVISTVKLQKANWRAAAIHLAQALPVNVRHVSHTSKICSVIPQAQQLHWTKLFLYFHSECTTAQEWERLHQDSYQVHTRTHPWRQSLPRNKPSTALTTEGS